MNTTGFITEGCARPCPGQAHVSGDLTVVMLRGQIVLLRITLFLFLAASFAIAQGGHQRSGHSRQTQLGNQLWIHAVPV